MKTGLKVLVCCALAQMVLGTACAQEKMDGRIVFATFQCNHCHGDDARTPKMAGTPKIAGLDRKYLAEKTGQMSERLAHKDAIGSCAEIPTRQQIEAIADWVSRLPN